MGDRWDMPYASSRSPVMASAAVATSQPLASAAGLGVLRDGGSAVDAAVATAAALTVVEPVSNGLGSDAFALVHGGDRLYGLNASGRSPGGWHVDRFAGQERMPQRGWDSVTVPGAVGGWVALWKMFGRLPLERLLAPAIGYARDGYAVGPVTARAWSSSVEALGGFEDFRRDFMPGGRAPRAGERFRLEAQAQTLESIVASEGESFYRGDLAERIAGHAQAGGGALTEEDLASYEAEWVEPIGMGLGPLDGGRGGVVWEIPPNG
ncbi:MAG: gamma-glutamyltransferase, partial [Planctomycetota bacterium]